MKQQLPSKADIKLFLQEYSQMLTIAGVLLALLLLIGFSAYNIYSQNTKIEAVKQEVDDLNKSVTTSKENQKLLTDNVDDYTQMFSRLIPDTEDYFSMIYALETLSQQSGFNISDYEIKLSDSKTDKISIAISGDGDANSFLNFLKNYDVGGGRLITNENLELSSNADGGIKLDLNFYHKHTDATVVPGKSLSAKDIALFERIKQKTSFIFKSSDTNDAATDNVQYGVKNNPFQ